MSAISVNIPDVAAMQRVAQALASAMQGGQVWFLRGDLGAGKTTIAAAIIAHLSPHPVAVTSPTFSLMQPYDVICKESYINCWHIDLYRLESQADIDELGIEELAEGNLLLIEWPERLSAGWPRDYIAVDLQLAPVGEARMVTLSFSGAAASYHSQILDAVRYAL